LQNKFQEASTKLYQQAGAAAGAGGPMPEGAGAADGPSPDSTTGAKDDVVDADFEMVDEDQKK